MTLRTAALAIIAIALTLVACGGGEADDAQPNSTFVADTDFTQEEARAIAEQALLQLEDFPIGWTERPADEDSGDDSDLDLPPECQEPDYPGKVASADSMEFHGPDDEEVESSVTIYTDETAASRAIAGAIAYLEECREPLGEAIEDFMKDSDDAPVEDLDVEVNIDRLSFPSYGDESIAFRTIITVSSDELPFDLDLFLDVFGVRVDRIVSAMTFVNIFGRPDTAMEEGLLSIIGQRLNSAASSAASSAPSQETETGSTEEETKEPIATSTAQPSDVGSRENPVPLGDSAELGAWSVRVLSTVPDATALVLGKNQFNDPPAAGRQFFFVRLQATRIGDGSGSFGFEMSAKALDDANLVYTTFGEDSSCGVIPEDIDTTAEAFQGGAVEGNACWSVRSDLVASLVMLVEELFSFDEQRVFFSLQ